MDKKLYVIDKKNTLSFNDMVKKIEKSQDKITYYYNENYICGKTIQYKIFDGIWVVYHDLLLKNLELFPVEQNGFIRMNYCISGRCEVEYKNNKVFYMGSGDFVVALLADENYKHNFPLSNYKGISITTTEKKLDVFLQNIFGGTKITSTMLIYKIREYEKYMILSNSITIQKIIEEMILPNEVFWKERAILKFAELILILIKNDGKFLKRKGKYFEKHMADKVKMIKSEITKNLDMHITIKEISKKYNISSRTFSECFKEIYGKTYYAFTKEFRIKKAAELICITDNTIGDIAMIVGYQNASKFSKAFFDIMGVSPRDFRKNNFTALLE